MGDDRSEQIARLIEPFGVSPLAAVTLDEDMSVRGGGDGAMLIGQDI